MVISTTIKTVSTLYSPFPMLGGLLWDRGPTNKTPKMTDQDAEVDVARWSSEEEDNEDGYRLVCAVNPLLNELETLFSSGNSGHDHEIDWRILLESSGYQEKSADLTNRLRDYWTNSTRSPTLIGLKVREFLYPVIEVKRMIKECLAKLTFTSDR